MICLTGDIHHSSLRTSEQRFIPDPLDSEVKIAVRYFRLVEEMGLKVTFYVTGKTLEEEWEDFHRIASSDLVEVGGHTYSGLPRTPLTLWKSRLTGKPAASHALGHGSYRRQKKDTERMISVVQRRIGKPVVSWRSHGLVVDRNTYPILRSLGIEYISDELNWNKIFPEKTPEGLISHPINVIMDHDHIYHAHRTYEYVEKQKKSWGFKDDPTRESYTAQQWGEIVKQQVQAIEERGGVATVLMHPICMYISDGFQTARQLLEFFTRFKVVWAREVGKYLKEQ